MTSSHVSTSPPCASSASSSHANSSSSYLGSSSRVPSNSETVLDPINSPGFQIVQDAFCRNFTTGARASVFTSSLASLQYCLGLHTISCEGLSLTACQNALIRHYVSGSCFDNAQKHSSGCDYSTCSNVSTSFSSRAIFSSAILNMLIQSDPKPISSSCILPSIRLNALRRLLRLNNIDYTNDDSLSSLRRELKKYITRLKRGKESEARQTAKANELQEKLEQQEEVAGSAACRPYVLYFVIGFVLILTPTHIDHHPPFGHFEYLNQITSK